MLPRGPDEWSSRYAAWGWLMVQSAAFRQAVDDSGLDGLETDLPDRLATLVGARCGRGVDALS